MSSRLSLLLAKAGHPIRVPSPIVPSVQIADGEYRGPKGRSCRLVNIRSGRTVSAASIGAFCRKARLWGNARFHLTPVLDGKRLQYKGWMLPSMAKAPLDIKDVFGNRYSPTVGQLVRSGKLSGVAIRRLANGHVFQGAVRHDVDTSAILPPRAHRIKSYVLKTPNGRLIEGPTLESAGAKAGLGIQSTFDLVHGYRGRAKGVTLHRVKIERRKAFDLPVSV